MKNIIMFLSIAIFFAINVTLTNAWNTANIIYGDSLSTWYCMTWKSITDNKIWFNYLKNTKENLVFAELWKTAAWLYSDTITNKSWNIVKKPPYTSVWYWFDDKWYLKDYEIFKIFNNSQNEYILDWVVINKNIHILDDIMKNKISNNNIILLGWNDLINETSKFNIISERAKLGEVKIADLNKCLKLKDKVNCINNVTIKSEWWGIQISFFSSKTKKLKDFIVDYYITNSNYKDTLSNETWLWKLIDDTLKQNKNSITYVILLPYTMTKNTDYQISKNEFNAYKINLKSLISKKKSKRIKFIEITEWQIKSSLTKMKIKDINQAFCDDKMHFSETGHKVIWNIINNYIK